MKLFKMLVVLTVVVVCGCAANIMQRKDAYQAFPVSPGKFEDLKSYTLVIFKANPVLLEAERGNAWYMVLRHPNGEVEKHVAVLAKQDNEDVLVAIIPHKLSSGVYAIVLSHDAKYYFNAEAEMFPAPRKIKAIDWEKTATPLQEVVEEIKVGSDEHERVLKWFREVIKDEVARQLNTVLDKKEYKNLKWSTKGGKVLVELAINGATFVIIFGEVFAFTKSWSIALANATLMETVKLLNLIFQIAQPNFNFPEYGSGYVTRWELAAENVRLRQYAEVLKQYAEALQNLAKEVNSLKGESTWQEQEIKKLKESQIQLKAQIEKLSEEIKEEKRK